ncbi:MAG TPA: acyl-CoA dehydrogenase family protein [Acidimicrobiales bacterium]|nr:acyl-CoA dehydrogenase family protein [Acidimicrobiales bacterium]
MFDKVLTRRGGERSVQVMGAGSDDVEEGRSYLSSLGPYAVPTWPEEYGGLAADAEQAAVIAEELRNYRSPDLYPFMVGIALVAPTLLTHGTPEQLQRWLPPMATGTEIWCQLFSEPGAGSDLAGLTCRAERDGDLWRVTGQKVWSSRAHYSRWGLLLARTNWDVPKHAGITCFGIDMEAPGVEVRPLRQMNGDTHFNEVFLDEAPVEDVNRIGDVDGGWRVAMTTLMHERASIGGNSGGGIGKDQLIATVAKWGGSNDPVTRQRLAAIVGELEVGRQTGLRARAAAESGKPPGPEGSGGKLRMSAALKAISNLALDVQGPRGVVGEGEWHTLFLTGPSFSIRGGTDEVQRNILGERVLGLPPEPRPDKDVAFRDVPKN